MEGTRDLVGRDKGHFWYTRSLSEKASRAYTQLSYYRKLLLQPWTHIEMFFVAFYDVSKAFDTVWTNGLFQK